MKSSRVPKKGDPVFLKTVTHYYTGRLASITHSWIVLEHAAWIAVTGRYNEALKKGFDKVPEAEIEPYPDDMAPAIARGGVVSMAPYRHKLPREAQ